MSAFFSAEQGQRFARWRLALTLVLSCVCSLLRAGDTTYRFSHFVGSAGGVGWQDGKRLEAKFLAPYQLAVDEAGNLYVTDGAVVRKISIDGVVSTLAGEQYIVGALNAVGSSARFDALNGIAVDGSGNIFVADSGNVVIRKINPSGAVSTIAGVVGEDRSNYRDNGSGTHIYHPFGLAADRAGNVYIGQITSITRVSADGKITDFTGGDQGGVQDGTGSSARFSWIQSLATDSAGSIYAADVDARTIRKVSSTGVVTTLAGHPGSQGWQDGVGATAFFANPTAVAVDSQGKVYVQDYGAVRVVTPAGVVTTWKTPPLVPGLLSSPVGGIAVDKAGNLYLANYAEAVICKITPEGTPSVFAGQAAWSGFNDSPRETARFGYVAGMCRAPDRSILVADYENSLVRKVDREGNVSTYAGKIGSGASKDGPISQATFHHPIAVASDTFGNVYVADDDGAVIRKISVAGDVTTFAGRREIDPNNHGIDSPFYQDGQGQEARFSDVVGMTIDGANNLYVTDRGNCCIRKVSTTGMVSTYAGRPLGWGYADGPAVDALFTLPSGIDSDPDGTLYVADGANVIRKITPQGMVSTIAGIPRKQGFANGSAVQALLDGPVAVASDHHGNIFFTDASSTIRKIGVDGSVSTVGGKPSRLGNDDGVGSDATFRGSGGLFLDSDGVLYIGERTSIRKGTPVEAGGRLVNISTRSYVGQGGDVMIAGFVITGDRAKTVLIRASGPSLRQFGITSTLNDPVLTLYEGSTAKATNDNWGDVPSEKSVIASAIRTVSAFAWDEGSADAAMVVTLSPGGYTAIVSGKSNSTGVALIEVFETDVTQSNSRLVNLSTRSSVRLGENVQIAGFVVSGNGPQRVVIRASGPALEKYGVPGYLDDPVLELHDATNQLAISDDWAPALRADFQTIGADNWAVGSKDAAIVRTLEPGGYTAIVRGKNGSTGVALIEIFESK